MEPLGGARIHQTRAKSLFTRLYPVKANKLKGPLARSGHRIVVDEGNIYCYGGYNPLVPEERYSQSGGRNMEEFPMFRELWKFNLASQQWTRLSTTGTVPEESASYAAILSDHKLIVFGGTGFPFAEVRNNLLFCCDLRSLHWSVLPCTGETPEKVYGHTMILLNGYIYLFGGTTGFLYHNDMFRLDIQTLLWERIGSLSSHDGCPSARYRHEMATDGKDLFVFGGGTSMTAETLEVIWAFNTDSHTWRVIPTKPDSVHDVYVTGGLGDNNRIAYKDVWKYDLYEHSWIKLPLNLSREVYFHATAMSPSGCMYAFGGVLMRQQDSTKRSKALYKVNLNVKSLVEICWEKLAQQRVFLEQSASQLLESGIPSYLLCRLDQNGNQVSEELVASAS